MATERLTPAEHARLANLEHASDLARYMTPDEHAERKRLAEQERAWNRENPELYRLEGIRSMYRRRGDLAAAGIVAEAMAKLEGLTPGSELLKRHPDREIPGPSELAADGYIDDEEAAKIEAQAAAVIERLSTLPVERLKPGEYAARAREAEARRMLESVHLHHPELVLADIHEDGCGVDIHLTEEATAGLELAADVKALCEWLKGDPRRGWSVLHNSVCLHPAGHPRRMPTLDAIHAAAEAVRKGEV